MFTQRLLQVVALAVLAAAVPGTARSQDAFDRAKTLYLEAAYRGRAGPARHARPGGYGPTCICTGRCACWRWGAPAKPTPRSPARSRPIPRPPPPGRTCRRASRPCSPMRDAGCCRISRADGSPMGGWRISRGDRLGATQRFEAAVRLLDDPSVANQSELTDLKTLASGFLDLLRAQSAPPAAAPPAALAAVTPAPAPVPAPGAGAALPPAAERAPPASGGCPGTRRRGCRSGRRRVAAEAAVPAHAAVAPARPVVEKP